MPTLSKPYKFRTENLKGGCFARVFYAFSNAHAFMANEPPAKLLPPSISGLHVVAFNKEERSEEMFKELSAIMDLEYCSPWVKDSAGYKENVYLCVFKEKT